MRSIGSILRGGGVGGGGNMTNFMTNYDQKLMDFQHDPTHTRVIICHNLEVFEKSA